MTGSRGVRQDGNLKGLDEMARRRSSSPRSGFYAKEHREPTRGDCMPGEKQWLQASGLRMKSVGVTETWSSFQRRAVSSPPRESEEPITQE
jgi:hypothetical protein